MRIKLLRIIKLYREIVLRN